MSQTPPDNGTNTPSNPNTNDTDTEALLAQCLTAKSVHVNQTGGVYNAACGDSGAACATIGRGLDQAEPDEVVCVHAGTYNESWLEVPSDVTMVSVDGPLTLESSTLEFCSWGRFILGDAL